MSNVYYLIDWPESQDFMEEEWFDEEAILSINGSSSYFIPVGRILTENFIKQQIEEKFNEKYSDNDLENTEDDTVFCGFEDGALTALKEIL